MSDPSSKEAEAAALLNLTLQTNTTTLELNELGLKDLPESFAQLRSMKLLPPFAVINLSRNVMPAVPRDLLDFETLTELILDDNRIIALPPEIGQLIQLKKLSLRRNFLTDLPHEISRMTSLAELDLTSNALASLPSSLALLSNLKLLVLNGNSKLLAFPPHIAKMSGTTIKLEGSLVIPQEILAQSATAILAYLADMDRLKLIVNMRAHWVPDDNAPKCNLCNASFTLTFRRHHCRVCGRCVCKKCSEHEVPIPIFHAKEAIRICNVSTLQMVTV